MLQLPATKYFRHVSDLHLNADVEKRFNPLALWTPPKMPEDDCTTLVVAGDIWESKKYFSFSNFSWVLAISQQFQYVIVVLGNHDYYGGSVGLEESRFTAYLKENQINNVFLLQNTCIKIGNVKVLGTTLWSNYNNGNAQSMYMAKNGYPNEDRTKINDYQYIRNAAYQKIHPKELLVKHLQAKQFILENAQKEAGVDKVLVVTHHAPSFEAIPSKYQAPDANHWKWHMSGCYASNLDALISECEIDLWHHGHTHEARQYWIGDTPVIVNPRGYGPKDKTNWNEYLRISASTFSLG